MKNPNRWQGKTSIFLLLFILVSSFFSLAAATDFKDTFKNNETAQTIPSLKKGMYLIVAVFQIKENAIQYVKSVKIDGASPWIAKREESNLYYIIAYDAKEDLEFARKKRAELRSTSQFYDAWILYEGINLEDLKEEEADLIALDEPEEAPKEEQVVPPPAPKDNGPYYLRFNVINAATLEEIPGDISLIDASSNSSIKSVSTNEVHELDVPTGKSLEIIASCDIFGFVKEQKRFKIDDLSSSGDHLDISKSDGIINVTYKLTRHKIGDILTIDNVYFYNNAAIMTPESKVELNHLLSMLEENDNLAIIIHGHTNGKRGGDLITLKEGDRNYFEITDNCNVDRGSAKELSKARAAIIARWLAENGVDRKRMQIKPWGGKKMIYNKHDLMASRNARVEIEIVKY